MSCRVRSRRKSKDKKTFCEPSGICTTVARIGQTVNATSHVARQYSIYNIERCESSAERTACSGPVIHTVLKFLQKLRLKGWRLNWRKRKKLHTRTLTQACKRVHTHTHSYTAIGLVSAILLWKVLIHFCFSVLLGHWKLWPSRRLILKICLTE